MTLKNKLAAYILSLEECLAKTHRAEDRSLYEKYLADAAAILAFSVSGKPDAELHSRIKSHERLWGHTWLQDEIYKQAADAWKAVKQEAKYETT
jgi:adenosyl cobinamide kinase/adenosyl cobinamide phosphate guanylyltransferase